MNEMYYQLAQYPVRTENIFSTTSIPAIVPVTRATFLTKRRAFA